MIAQLVEHIHGKDEVSGSIPDLGSRIDYKDEDKVDFYGKKDIISFVVIRYLGR